VDQDGDGNISYAEFMPLCFNILVERFKDDVLAEAALQSSDALTQMLLEEFEAKERSMMGAEGDGGATGRLTAGAVKAALTVRPARYCPPRHPPGGPACRCHLHPCRHKA